MSKGIPLMNYKKANKKNKDMSKGMKITLIVVILIIVAVVIYYATKKKAVTTEEEAIVEEEQPTRGETGTSTTPPVTTLPSGAVSRTISDMGSLEMDV